MKKSVNITLGITSESEELEFKRFIDFQNKKSAEELALDICQFANSNGGEIFIGVKEIENTQKQLKTAESYVDINIEKTLEFINNKVIQLIHPKTVKFEIKPITIDENTNILSINVRPLASGVACVCNNQEPYYQKFPYRTNYGKKYLNPSDVELRMTNKNRYIRITLEELIEQSKYVTLFPEVKKDEISKDLSWDTKEPISVLKQIRNTEYTVNIAGIDINIPYSLTEDVWITETQTIGILLKVNLTINSDRKKVKFEI